MTPNRASLFSSKRLLGKVTPKYGDYVLLACCYVTGLLDAAAFNNWGVFVGMQTGNTVILCLSSAGLPRSQPHANAATGIVLASFLLGVLTTFHLSTLAGKDRRLTLMCDVLSQGLLITLAAILTTPSFGLVPRDDRDERNIAGDIRIVTVLPALGFQAGAQISTSRLLGYGELPVNVLTSTYADLMGDPALLRWPNIKRNRRLGAVVCVVSGSICAAWIMERGPGIFLCLWLGAGIKLVVAVCMLLFMEEKVDVEEEKDIKSAKERVVEDGKEAVKQGEKEGNQERR